MSDEKKVSLEITEEQVALRDALNKWQENLILSGVERGDIHAVMLAHVGAESILIRGKAMTSIMFLHMAREIIQVPDRFHEKKE